MEKVILKPLYHRGEECIGIYFERNAAIQTSIQKNANARWRKTHTCWYTKCTDENYLLLKTTLENKAEVNIF